MISLIICSRNKELLQPVLFNVEKTIGVAYEIIAIDNENGEYGICKAYNIGAEKSKFNYLCFMHEDIMFHTQNWGRIVVELLEDLSIGLVGVTGSKYLVDAPAPWWGGGMEFCRRNVLERYADNRQEMILQNPDKEELSEVVAVDGLWFCTRKQVWAANKFDQKTFPYFHFYDLDFSAQIVQHFKIVVTFKILIEHFSRGTFNDTWVKSAIEFAKKWQSQLPVTCVNVSSEQKKRNRAKAYQSFATRLISLHYDKQIAFKYILKSLSYDFFNKDNFWLLKQLLKF